VEDRPDHRATLELFAGYQRRDDQLFAGIGSLAPDPERGASRYQIDAGDVRAIATLRAARPLTFELGAQLGVRRYGDGRPYGSDPPISFRYCVRVLNHCPTPGVDERLVPGFHDGTEFVRLRAALHLDTYDSPGRPAAGLKFDLGMDHTQALLAADSYVRVDAGLAVPLSLFRRTHVLVLSVRAQAAWPLSGGPVPFSELPTLGLEIPLRGVRNGFYRDQSLLLLSAEYRWPIWMWADGYLFNDWGEVAGRSFAGFSAQDLHPGVGGGIRIRTSVGVLLRLQLAYGFSEGFQFGFILGNGR
jgi:hypothetical protein